MSKTDTRDKKASSPPASADKPAKARKPLVSIQDRIPAMSDGELDALHANAKRLAESGAAAQQADAQRLLPVIGAEVEARAAVRAQALQARREALREKRKAKPSRARK